MNSKKGHLLVKEKFSHLGPWKMITSETSYLFLADLGAEEWRFGWCGFFPASYSSIPLSLSQDANTSPSLPLILVRLS